MIGPGPAPLLQAAMIELEAVCHDCRKRHDVKATPATWLDRMSEWEVKHRGHAFEFRTRRRSIFKGLKDRWVYAVLDRWGVLPWWLTYAENADRKLAYAASAAYTITLSSLASSATFVAGRESTAVSNTTNLYEDYLVGGKVTVGTTPTTLKQINIYAHGSVDDTPTYIDVLDGTDSAETFPNAEVLAALPILHVMGVVATTSDIPYWMPPRALSLAFGGVVPKNHGLYVAHSTVAALNGTAGNHVLSYTGVYGTG